MMARASATAASASCELRSRFRGCLAGAVAGDCIGRPFEMGTLLPKGVTLLSKVAEFVHKLDRSSSTETSNKKKILPFTDDTAMARSVVKSLIECMGQYDARNMAQRFSQEFTEEPDRGYGANVVEIFPALGNAQIRDVYEPARTQFNGKGSYGNGGAMRIAPVGLCLENNLPRVIEIARESTKLTHSNKLGYDGAILQACAVHLALHSDPVNFNPKDFVDSLLAVMKDVEGSDDVYSDKLGLMKTMLDRDASPRDVVQNLGNGIAAHQSVPAAVYSFLTCSQPVPSIPTDNRMVRTLIYAISLDGDTDTIGSMAGAIAGAFYGVEEVPDAWMSLCEGMDDAIKQADQLLDIMTGEKNIRG